MSTTVINNYYYGKDAAIPPPPMGQAPPPVAQAPPPVAQPPQQQVAKLGPTRSSSRYDKPKCKICNKNHFGRCTTRCQVCDKRHGGVCRYSHPVPQKKLVQSRTMGDLRDKLNQKAEKKLVQFRTKGDLRDKINKKAEEKLIKAPKNALEKTEEKPIKASVAQDEPRKKTEEETKQQLHAENNDHFMTISYPLPKDRNRLSYSV